MDARLTFEEFFSRPRLILAPLAGVGDSVFRGLCADFGAELTYSEMISAKALSYGSVKTFDLLELSPSEKRVSIQIFGHEPDTMAQQAERICELADERVFAIDINMGCPVRKIAGKGDGAALMRDPQLAAQIIKLVSSHSSLPVTVKFRRGFDMKDETAVEFALMAQENGAAAVAVHGRFARQFYQGSADWGVIARVKQGLEIPVIGNGDIVDGPSAKEMLDTTGCDALMIGRGAQGSPWVFESIRTFLETGEELPARGAKERMEVAKKHAMLLHEKHPGSIVGMRKHAMWYLKGLVGATQLRRRVNDASSLEDFLSIFDEAVALNEGNE